MELLDGMIQLPGDARDGLRRVGFAQHRREDFAHPPRGHATQKTLPDQFVDRCLAALVARQEPGAKPPAGAGDLESAEQAELGGEIAPVGAVAVVHAKFRIVLVIAELEIRVALGFQRLFDQGLHLTAHLVVQGLLKELFPVRDLQLKMPVVEDFEFSHQGVPPPCEFALQRDVHPLFFL
jgi:hypothetical protein